MWEKFKWYLVEVGIKKYAPMGAMAAVTSLGTFMMAHAGMLEQYGVNYIPDWSADWLKTHSISGPAILIELDTLSKAAMIAVIAAITVVMRAAEHHVNPTTAVPGGARAGDPPSEEQPKGE